MTMKNSNEINIIECNYNKNDLIYQDFIPDELKADLKNATVLFIPKIFKDKPYFEIQTQDLYYYLKKEETENLKVEICIAEEELEYFITEAEEIFIVLGWFFVEEFVLKPFIERIKKYIQKKFRKPKPIKLKLTIKSINEDKIIELEYKGSIENLDHIFSRLKEF